MTPLHSLRRHQNDFLDELRHKRWYHSFDLPDGSRVEGVMPMEWLRSRWSRFPIPADLTGRRVLDIFAGLTGTGTELGADATDAPQFRIGTLNIRLVTPRNAPSIINAAFTVRKFVDGRASDVFTGRTPFGDSDPRANAVAVVDGQLKPEFVRLINSSLASQSVAPPLNPVEMSYAAAPGQCSAENSWLCVR